VGSGGGGEELGAARLAMLTVQTPASYVNRSRMCMMRGAESVSMLPANRAPPLDGRLASSHWTVMGLAADGADGWWVRPRGYRGRVTVHGGS